MLNIRRLDHDASHTHYWRVMVQRRTHLFRWDCSDGRHGGSEQALMAAQRYRDSLIQTYPPLAMPAYCAILKKNNRSGVSGLMRVDRVEVCKGRRQRKLYWEAQWPIGDGRSTPEVLHPEVWGGGGVSVGPRCEKDRASRAVRSDVLTVQ